MTRIAEIDPWTGRVARVRRRLERLRRGTRPGAAEAVRRVRARPGPTPRDRGAAARAPQSGARRRRFPRQDDRRFRPARDEGAVRQGAPGGEGAGAGGAGRQAVRAVAAAPLARRRAASGRSRRVPRERCRRAWHVPARPDRSRPRAGRAHRGHRPERQRQVDAARAPARRASARRRHARASAGRP